MIKYTLIKFIVNLSLYYYCNFKFLIIKFLNLKRMSCGFKNIRMRVYGAWIWPVTKRTQRIHPSNQSGIKASARGRCKTRENVYLSELRLVLWLAENLAREFSKSITERSCAKSKKMRITSEPLSLNSYSWVCSRWLLLDNLHLCSNLVWKTQKIRWNDFYLIYCTY